jgi:hypothetical protein
MPDINVSKIGGSRTDITIKLDDGTKVSVAVASGGSKVTVTTPEGETSTTRFDNDGNERSPGGDK